MRKRDKQAFPVKNSVSKSDEVPIVITSPRNIRSKLSSLQKRITKIRDDKIKKETIKQEKKLKETEEKLQKKLKEQTTQEENLGKLIESQKKLALIKARNKAAQEALDSFTLRGKIRKAVKADIKARKDFAKSPKGKRLRKKQVKQIKKISKKIFG